ncbi:PREDICTED: junctional adhesion molecule-like isoform X2 [Chinchilla lanigera]|uniref:junctional adhesion molecule-like isoform X2 n=1 Tax=Chinchilla lanigera TaxID=34839 RepID=UPI000696DA37|nr:PREDICTED: junctional adhesion molecule-like isoform X2 [Chinchilla lanigera]
MPVWDLEVVSSMFCPLKLILMPVLLDYSLGLNDLNALYPKLTVHVGDSALMGCIVQNTQGKSVTKVDWTHSPEQHGKDEYVLYYYSNLTVPCGRFKNRSRLVGDVSQNDGSLLLQDVQEADQGNYTCEIRLENESRVFKKAVVLHVLPEDPKEIVVHEGESALMGCHFQSTEEKRVTKVYWMFSSGQQAKEETVLLYNLNNPVRYPQSQGRFQNRVTLVDIAHNDGAIMLQRVKESDKGRYTCSIYLGSLMFRNSLTLHVIQESQTSRSEILGGTHVVIIVGIVCATLLLLTGLIVIVKKRHRNKSSESSTAIVESLEHTRKASLEKHVYSAIAALEMIEEPNAKSEAIYMIMHPAQPSLRSDPNNVSEKKTVLDIPKTDQAF